MGRGSRWGSPFASVLALTVLLGLLAQVLVAGWFSQTPQTSREETTATMTNNESSKVLGNVSQIIGCQETSCVWQQLSCNNRYQPHEPVRLHQPGWPAPKSSVCVDDPHMIRLRHLGHGGTAIRAPYYNLTHDSPFFWCWIAKNSCTKMKSFFIRLAGKKYQAPFKALHMIFYGMSRKMYNKSAVRDEQLHEWFHQPNMKRIIIIRDPIDRFVSGYLDKVHPKEMPEWLKRTRKTNDSIQFELSPQGIHRWLDEVDNWISHDHLGLQSNWCGIRMYGLKIWNRIYVYDKNKMPDVMEEITKDLNLEPLLHGWGANKDERLYGYPTVHAHDHNEHGPLVTKSICERLFHILFEDYANFYPLIMPPNCSQYPDIPWQA